MCVVTGPGTNATDFAQLVAWLRANTAKAAYGIPSNGTIPHFAGTRIEAALNLPMTRVPYRGGAAVVKDVIGGHLPFAVITLADALPSHQAGSVRILAVSSEKRSPFLPDVPTLKESGIDLVADSWYGMWLPAGAPPEFARQLSAAVVTVLGKARREGQAARDRPHSGRHDAGGTDAGACRQHGVLAADRAGDGVQDHELIPILLLRIAASSASSQMPIRMPPFTCS